MSNLSTVPDGKLTGMDKVRAEFDRQSAKVLGGPHGPTEKYLRALCAERNLDPTEFIALATNAEHTIRLVKAILSVPVSK